MKFKNIQDLLNQVNKDLGEFCNKFIYKRKELVGASRVGKRGKLFVYDSTKDHDWAINSGGGTEVQYHLAFHEEPFELTGKPRIVYGIGFNAQYVQFSNDMEPQEYIRPYMQSFLNLESSIRSQLPDYSFIYGNHQTLKDPKRDDYVLFGNQIGVKRHVDENFEIEELRYEQILSDLKSQFGAYVQIFEERNRLIKTKSQAMDYINLLKSKGQIILQGPPGTGKTFTAKDLAYQVVYGTTIVEGSRKKQLQQLEKSDQFELIQFHPAYSYEDFVRGITAKSNGSHISYITEDRILSKLAKKAHQNFIDSQKESRAITREQWIRENLIKFADQLSIEIEEGKEYPLSPAVNIVSVDEDAFRYTGGSWKDERRMKFEDIITLFDQSIDTRIQIKNCTDVSPLAISHATYYKALLDRFSDYMSDEKEPKKPVKIAAKDYVLIIDEINRANLPAVLGELVYALEYRGEEVSSLYEIDGSGKISIPPNLYIIGTMNTADRSIGHIDYAIRRRFAFVEIDANIEVIKNENAKKLFSDVQELFSSEYLSAEFKKKDVQLGHSYFLAETNEQLEISLNYEIKPILREYISDGILLSSASEKIEELKLV